MQLCAQTMFLHIVKNEAKVIINLNLSNPLCENPPLSVTRVQCLALSIIGPIIQNSC
jgi:hypothetical protein